MPWNNAAATFNMLAAGLNTGVVTESCKMIDHEVVTASGGQSFQNSKPRIMLDL
jgi:hypothetical protein